MVPRSTQRMVSQKSLTEPFSFTFPQKNVVEIVHIQNMKEEKLYSYSGYLCLLFITQQKDLIPIFYSVPHNFVFKNVSYIQTVFFLYNLTQTTTPCYISTVFCAQVLGVLGQTANNRKAHWFRNVLKIWETVKNGTRNKLWFIPSQDEVFN